MSKSASFFRFLLSLANLVRPHLKNFVVALAALALGSVVNLFLPQLAKYLLDTDYGRFALENPWITVSSLAAVFALQNFFFYLRSSLFSQVGISVGKNLREKLFLSLINKPLEFHDTNNWADTRSRLISDIQLIQDAVSLRLSVFIRYSLQVLVAAVCMVFISTKLTLLTLSVLPLLILGGIFMGKRLKRYSVNSQEKLAIVNGCAEEGLGQIRLVKLLGAETDFSKKFIVNNGDSAKSLFERASYAAFFSSSMNFLLTVAIVAVLIYGLAMVDTGGLTQGDFAAFSLYGVTVAVSFAFAISSYSELLQASVAGDRVLPLIVPHVKNADLNSLESSEVNKSLSIEFRDVSFSYPSRLTTPVFQKLSFQLEPNSCTAIVGSSGAGKSSILNLIAGLYSPIEGEVLIGGLGSAHKINFAKTKLLAVVPQDGFLISASLRENLCLGSKDYSDAELKSVLVQVRLDHLLSDNGLNLDSELGERGSQLSGGQRQRIAIARAILKKPAVLLLDEASSALDPESENVLLEILNELKKTTTVILVTHRVSSLSVADKILVLLKGKIVQEGSYQDIVLTPGFFKNMLDSNLIQEA
jgi:ABC-type multidrug transport system fused ATPase/permease subunit